jgi:2'-5' RNA ligase
MRLFTGIDLPEPILDRLGRLLALLRPTAHLKWSPLDNLHITTKFIGEWPEEKLETFKTALGAIQKRRPIEIAVEGLGWFPNPQKPRVFWAGVHGGQALRDLAGAIEHTLEPVGVAAETRPYSPHLTLARISQPAPLTPVLQAIAKLDSVEFGSFQATTFYLYLSAGGVYTKLSEFRFAA